MDTICAVSTARAAAAIGVVRISGRDAVSICQKIIKLKSGELYNIPPARLRRGTVWDEDFKVDDVMCAVFRAPASYTGEDIVEINCHGGLLILDKIMRLLIKNGARAAEGGEFTKRAFLNGKLDLVQAEAVGDLINATSAADAAMALGRMEGSLSREFGALFDELISLNTDILAYIDFPDEGISDVSADRVLSVLYDAQRRLDRLERSFSAGGVIHDGADTVLLGAPNVGKSTLLNTILGYERALVSDAAGTTRDVLRERVNFGGITLNISDTAGLRNAARGLEKRGIDFTMRELMGADLVFALFDGSRPPGKDDLTLLPLCRGKTAVAVITKCDLPTRADLSEIEAAFSRVVRVSAVTGEGIEQLEKEVRALFLSDRLSVESGMLVSNARHYDCVKRALDSVRAAIKTVKDGFTPDLASPDITAAASALGMITGAQASERIIDEIFSKFCVGK